MGALLPLVRGPDLAEVAQETPLGHIAEHSDAPREPDLSGLDLTDLEIHPDRVTSPLPSGLTAELTLRPGLQRAAQSLLERYDLPEAGVVLLDVETANTLVYASRVGKGKRFDVNVRAEAPAASIFKIITGAALLQKPGISSDTEQCYRGGLSRIRADELIDNPRLDRSCASLAVAMGRSINVVFARLAGRHLTPERLTQAAHAFGFGRPTPFDVPTEAPKVELPTDPLEFARAAAGFWHTTLSPLAGAAIALAIANDGLMLAPRVVRALSDGATPQWLAAAEPSVVGRAVEPRAAHELTQMMIQTVASGSAFKSFRTAAGTSYLPFIPVAGKTGTLSRSEANRYYTWFVGFAPANDPEVAVAALVVNGPIWRLKAPHLARDVLRAYFAERGYPRVTPP